MQNNNPFLYSQDNKRYHTLHYANMKKYGGRVYKAVVDAGFTCPNRDGTKSRAGCIFCSNRSGIFTFGALSVEQQLEKEIARIHAKVPNAKVVAYFQAGTNTYAPLPALQAAITGVKQNPWVVGISLGTRPDCLPQSILDYLEAVNHEKEITIELGLQTIHDSTARVINRCYDYNCFLQAYTALKQRGIRVCVHLINGLPQESSEMMVQSAKAVGQLGVDGVKIHALHIIDTTPLAQAYCAGSYVPMSQEAYINTVVEQLAYLPAKTVVERLTGDGDKRTLLAPMWSRDKIKVLGSIDKRQAELNTWQGKFYSGMPK
ncbi:MAG: TIGR01212 family radical SAM protein [Oscillospiraceae bacterium]|nr:TIGR01212 family radical SAM protein [Oscillospiraceae bacterium]